MTTLIVPCHCDGGADRVASALGLRQLGSEWIGDCPGCKGSKALSVRQSRDGHPDHVLCFCRGACVDATTFRTALSELLGPGSLLHPHRNTRIAADLPKIGGGGASSQARMSGQADGARLSWLGRREASVRSQRVPNRRYRAVVRPARGLVLAARSEVAFLRPVTVARLDVLPHQLQSSRNVSASVS